MYCVAITLYSTEFSTLKIHLTPMVIQYSQRNELSPSSLNVGLPLPTTSRINYTSDYLCVPTAQCFTMGILWTGLLAHLFKYLSDDYLLDLSIRLVNRGLLASVTNSMFGKTSKAWNDWFDLFFT